MNDEGVCRTALATPGLLKTRCWIIAPCLGKQIGSVVLWPLHCGHFFSEDSEK